MRWPSWVLWNDNLDPHESTWPVIIWVATRRSRLPISHLELSLAGLLNLSLRHIQYLGGADWRWLHSDMILTISHYLFKITIIPQELRCTTLLQRTPNSQLSVNWDTSVDPTRARRETANPTVCDRVVVNVASSHSGPWTWSICNHSWQWYRSRRSQVWNCPTMN